MNAIHVLPGDIFFTRSNSTLGRLIRWAETDPKEQKTWANHTGVVVTAGWLVPPFDSPDFTRAFVIESLWKTERWAWWDAHKNDKQNEVRVYRRPTLSWLEAVKIESEARKFVGRTYGWWKLGAHLVDRLAFGGRKTVSNLLGIDRRPICSYTAASAYAAADIFFGIVPEAADPDELMDYCETSGEWVPVGGALIGGAK